MGIYRWNATSSVCGHKVAIHNGDIWYSFVIGMQPLTGSVGVIHDGNIQYSFECTFLSSS